MNPDRAGGGGGELMDQCSRHDTPSAISDVLTIRPVHVLTLELDALFSKVLSGRWLGDSITQIRETVQTH
jgi:hypothetical protein